MAKFLNTSATTYYLEELIKKATGRLYIVSPFLKFNPKIRELLDDRNNFKIDTRVVYGKSELAPSEISWLQSREFIRTSFCQNLHAKCYMNQDEVIITSMNLYEFSQQHNNEMGVYASREADPELFKEAEEEVLRIIRISEEVRLSAVTVPQEEQPRQPQKKTSRRVEPFRHSFSKSKVSTSKLAKALGTKTPDLLDAFEQRGLLSTKGDEQTLTKLGEEVGGELRDGRYGPYFLWPEDLTPEVFD